MGFHTYDVGNADALDDPSRFRFLSVEELLSLFDPRGTIADLGSGTGFYTDEVAPHAETVYAVDVQAEMHDHYRQKGIPGNVSVVTAEIDDLPFEDGALDGAFSTNTFHEFATEDALGEVRRVLAVDAPLVVADWSASGRGADGPPVDERFDAADAREMLAAAGFADVESTDRVETLFAVALA